MKATERDRLLRRLEEPRRQSVRRVDGPEEFVQKCRALPAADIHALFWHRFEHGNVQHRGQPAILKGPVPAIFVNRRRIKPVVLVAKDLSCVWVVGKQKCARGMSQIREAEHRAAPDRLIESPFIEILNDASGALRKSSSAGTLLHQGGLLGRSNRVAARSDSFRFCNECSGLCGAAPAGVGDLLSPPSTY